MRRPREIGAAALVVVAGASMCGALYGADLARHLPPEGAPYIAEETRVRCPDGQSLGGTITLPARGTVNGKRLVFAGVVLVGEGGGRDRDGIPVADTLASPGTGSLYALADSLTRRGLAVLRVDDRGAGASTGPPGSATSTHRTSDARAAFDYLAHREEVDPSRIALVGIGEGASIAALVSSIEPSVRTVVAVATPGDSSPPPPIGEVPLPAAQLATSSALVVWGGAATDTARQDVARVINALRTSGRDVALHPFGGLAADLGTVAAPDARPGLYPLVTQTTAEWLTARLGGPQSVSVRVPRVRRRRHS